MNKRDRCIYEFGDFRIGDAEGSLRRGTDHIPLSPLVTKTLLVLLESAGRTITKGELMKLIWEGTIIEPGGLNQNICALRRIFGDDRRKPEYIKTIARVGFRFIKPVRVIREERSFTKALAVLPLENVRKDSSEKVFADGMTDELIHSLMRIEALKVSPRTSVMPYQYNPKPLPQVVRELEVDWVVEGTILRAGDRVRITVCLIDGVTEKHVWTESYEKDMLDVLTLQRDVASAIAREVQVKLTPQEKANLAKSRTVDPEAYCHYLFGRHFWNARTTEQLKRAIQYFRRAIDKDPTYAPAHAGLADAYALLGSVGYDSMPPTEVMPMARSAATHALAIDDTLAEAHTSLGYVKLVYDWDWAGAERDFRRSIELDPCYASAHQWYAHCLMAMGRLDDALHEMGRAVDLEPLSVPCNLGLGWSYYYLRRYDEAIEQYRKVAEIAPNLPMVFYELGLVYQNQKRYPEALAQFEKAFALSGGEAAAVMLMGHLYALVGRTEEAHVKLARLREMAAEKYVPALYFAFIYVGMNDRDQIFEWYQKALEERSHYLIYQKVEPSLEHLHSDSRFEALLRQIGLDR